MDMGNGSESSDARSSVTDTTVQVPSHLRDASSDPRTGQDDVIRQYEAKLRTMKWLGLITVTIHSFNKFLGFCALTWATVVVLGGYVSELGKPDFDAVSVLLLLEAFRLAVATLFANIVTRNLVYRSPDPLTLRYDDSDRQKIFAVARVAGHGIQVLFVAITITVSFLRFPHARGEEKPDYFDGLRYSLRIFYSLVVVNGIVIAIGAFQSIVIVPYFVTSYSLRRYYDEVVWRGISTGLLEANHFDFLRFAFEAQSEEYRRNMRPTAVRALYEDLLVYLFWHRKGFDAARNALDSSDSSEQEAAANIVGLWTKHDKEEKRLRLQRRLLSKLADMVDNQSTGRAAVSSFQHLAEIDPEAALQVQSESGNKNLTDILINRIEEVVNAGKYDKTLVYVKALIPMIPILAVQNSQIAETSLLCLKEKLLVVFQSNCLMRTKAVAGYALRKLTENREPNEGEVTRCLVNQPRPRTQFILKDEKRYLEKLFENSSGVLDKNRYDKAMAQIKFRDDTPPPVPESNVYFWGLL